LNYNYQTKKKKKNKQTSTHKNIKETVEDAMLFLADV